MELTGLNRVHLKRISAIVAMKSNAVDGVETSTTLCLTSMRVCHGADVLRLI